MKFKTKMISTAVVAALGASGAAQAVHLSADGQGQVLLYPYYNVQTKGSTAYDTYITIVNSDTVNGKAVKVRFIEGKASRETLDFNLYLSPNDMWTGAITRTAAGDPMLRTTDNSCTAPEILTPAGASSTTSGVTREAAFVNFDYSGDAVKDNSLTRAKEGYVEVIQMGDLTPLGKTASGLNTYAAALHNAGGVPANCAAIRNGWLPVGTPSGYTSSIDGIAPPTGTLSGAGTIINPLEGTDITYDGIAVNNFSSVPLHFAPGSIRPNLGDINPKVSAILQGQSMVLTDWGLTPAPLSMPVSALLMRDQVINEFAVAAAPVGLSTDWVVTFPTKRDHVEQASLANKAPFTSSLGTNGACESVSLTTYNREEAQQTTGLIFSPPQLVAGNNLCWEANVVALNSSAVISNALGGVNTKLGLTLPFPEGWLRMGFAQTRVAPALATSFTDLYTGVVTTPATGTTYTGLPVVGFAAMTFVNTSSLANYGGSYTHRYSRRITP
jgi:hypothetical protein